MKQFQGLIGIGAIQDPIIRESLRQLDTWARQVKDPEGAPLAGDSNKATVEGGRPVPIGADAWPVGSVFLTADARNPATTLGFGVWIPYGAGRFLVGLDSTDTDFDEIGETGGTKEHTLTDEEVP